MKSPFQAYQGGIQPAQGISEAGANIGRMYAEAGASAGQSIAKGLQKYYENEAISQEATEEIRMSMDALQAFAQYAPGLEKEIGETIENANKAIAKGGAANLAGAAKGLRYATQNFYGLVGLDFRKQESLAADKVRTEKETDTEIVNAKAILEGIRVQIERFSTLSGNEKTVADLRLHQENVTNAIASGDLGSIRAATTTARVFVGASDTLAKEREADYISRLGRDAGEALQSSVGFEDREMGVKPIDITGAGMEYSTNQSVMDWAGRTAEAVGRSAESYNKLENGTKYNVRDDVKINALESLIASLEPYADSDERAARTLESARSALAVLQDPEMANPVDVGIANLPVTDPRAEYYSAEALSADQAKLAELQERRSQETKESWSSEIARRMSLPLMGLGIEGGTRNLAGAFAQQGRELELARKAVASQEAMIQRRKEKSTGLTPADEAATFRATRPIDAYTVTQRVALDEATRRQKARDMLVAKGYPMEKIDAVLSAMTRTIGTEPVPGTNKVLVTSGDQRWMVDRETPSSAAERNADAMFTYGRVVTRIDPSGKAPYQEKEFEPVGIPSVRGPDGKVVSGRPEDAAFRLFGRLEVKDETDAKKAREKLGAFAQLHNDLQEYSALLKEHGSESAFFGDEDVAQRLIELHSRIVAARMATGPYGGNPSEGERRALTAGIPSPEGIFSGDWRRMFATKSDLSQAVDAIVLDNISALQRESFMRNVDVVVRPNWHGAKSTAPVDDAQTVANAVAKTANR